MQLDNIDLSTGAATETPITFEGTEFQGFLYGLAVSSVTCEEPTPIVLAPTGTC